MKNRTKDRIKNGLEFVVGVGTIMYIKSAEISNQLVKGNVPDIIYPITNYTLARFLFLKKPSLSSALALALMGTAAEIAQNFGMCRGTYDIKDIPCYFIGATLAYGLDKLTYKQDKAKFVDGVKEEGE